MAKSLHIGKKDKVTGLTVYCNRCRTDVSEICRQTGSAIERCPSGERHVFKMYAHIPGTRNKRLAKILETRDIREAKKLAIQFSGEVKNAVLEPVNISAAKTQSKAIPAAKAAGTPHVLIHALARHIAWMRGENVPSFEKKDRSEGHIRDTERAYEVFLQCLHKHGHEVAMLTVGAINKQMVGELYDYLQDEKKFANRTINKHLTYYTSFISWYSEEFEVPIKNIFHKVQRKTVVHNPQAITGKEFSALLEIITPERGLHRNGRSYYRPFLKDALKLSLFTGRRREEVMKLRHSNIVCDSEGNEFITIDDFKVNRIQNRNAEEEKKIIYIPITQELRQLLNECGYEKYKNTDAYVIAPEIKDRSKYLFDSLTKGFSHYYKQLNTGRDITFKALRKTYITNLHIYLGSGNAKAVSGHGTDEVVEEHYLARKELALAAQGYQVFSKEIERKNGLKMAKNKLEKSREAGYEK